jgi:hypothetical protein
MPPNRPKTEDELMDRIFALMPDCRIDTDEDSGEIVIHSGYAADNDTGDLIELEGVDDEDDELDELDEEEDDEEDMA